MSISIFKLFLHILNFHGFFSLCAIEPIQKLHVVSVLAQVAYFTRSRSIYGTGRGPQPLQLGKVILALLSVVIQYATSLESTVVSPSALRDINFSRLSIEY